MKKLISIYVAHLSLDGKQISLPHLARSCRAMCQKLSLDVSVTGFYRIIQVLKWARENGCPWTSRTCSTAAAAGHLKTLRWAREHGCPWNKTTCSYAAAAGHLEVLRWAYENGLEGDARTCALAAKGGHLEVLQFVREHECPWSPLTCKYQPSTLCAKRKLRLVRREGPFCLKLLPFCDFVFLEEFFLVSGSTVS